MENVTNVISKLKKNILPGINLFEAVLFTLATTVGIALFIVSLTLWKDGASANTKDYVGYLITLIDIPLGVLAATFLAKRSKLAPALLAVDAILYGTSNFLAGNIALGIVNAILTPLIYIIALIWIWPKETEEGSSEVTTRKLNLTSGIAVATIVIAISAFFGWILPLILPKTFEDTSHTEMWLNSFSTWFDAFAASLMLMAVIMSALRFRETFYLYLFSNIVKIVLFTTTIALGYKNDAMLLVLAISYFINALFGIMVWSLESEQFKKEKQA